MPYRSFKKPYKKRYKKTYRKAKMPKKLAARKYISSGKGVSLRTLRPEFPINRAVTMKYTLNFQMDPVADNDAVIGAQNNMIRANSIYLPDARNVDTHCAMGYDQWEQFYNEWVVTASRIKVKFRANQNQDVSAGPTLIAVQLTDSSKPIDHERAMENGSIKFTLMNDIFNTPVPKVLRSSYNAKSFNGCTDVVDNEDLYGDFDHGHLEGNPNQQIADFFPNEVAYYRILVAPDIKGQNTGLISVRCDVEYDVVFSGPRDLPRTHRIVPIAVDPDADQVEDGGNADDPEDDQSEVEEESKR